MSEAHTWDVTAANNNSAAPNGWPEGMIGSTVPGAGREFMAAIAKLFADTNGTLTATHTSGNALTLTTNRTFAAYLDGMTFTFTIAGSALSAGAVTLNVNSLGAKAINGSKQVDGKDLPVGEVVTVIYKSGTFQLVNCQQPAIEYKTSYSFNGNTGYYSAFFLGPLRITIWEGTIAAGTSKTMPINASSGYSPTPVFGAANVNGFPGYYTYSFPMYMSGTSVTLYNPLGATADCGFYSIVIGICP